MTHTVEEISQSVSCIVSGHHAKMTSHLLMQLSSIKHKNAICRMTNYELLRWLVKTRSRDVGHNRTLHSWASDRATCFHSVTHVARIFPKL